MTRHSISSAVLLLLLCAQSRADDGWKPLWNGRDQSEWNTVELVCCGEDSIHIVNGGVVMRLHAPRRIDGIQPASVTLGPVILQSEFAERHADPRAPRNESKPNSAR